MKEGWIDNYWQDVLTIISGRNQTEVQEENGKYPILGSAGKIMGYANRYLCEGNTTIIGRKGTINNPIFVEYPFWNVDTAFGLSAGPQLENRYLYYFCCSYDFSKEDKGSGRPSLVKSDLLRLKIPTPSLPEQQRIVSIIDKAFEAIDKAIENTQKNLQNAKDLFESYLHKFYTSTFEGWEEKKLKDVAEYFNGLTYSPKDVSNEGIIVLRSSNVQNDELDFNDIIRVNLEVKEKIKVKDGDVLMCSRNGSARLVGKTATIKNLSEVMTFGTFMMIVRSPYNPYLAWFFKSEGFRSQIKGGENTMINQITRYMLDDISLSFPPVHKQIEIVEKLDTLSVNLNNAQTLYQQKLRDLEELKKSVLNKAFAGEL